MINNHGVWSTERSVNVGFEFSKSSREAGSVGEEEWQERRERDCERLQKIAKD